MFNRFAPMKSIVLFIAIVDSGLCKTYLVETKDSYGVTSPNQTLGEETDFYDPLTLVNIHNILILTRKICLKHLVVKAPCFFDEKIVNALNHKKLRLFCSTQLDIFKELFLLHSSLMFRVVLALRKAQEKISGV